MSQRRACFCSSCRKVCFSMSFRNSPCLSASRSACRPHSATRRESSTATASAFWMVDRRCAMITTVRPVEWHREGPQRVGHREGGTESESHGSIKGQASFTTALVILSGRDDIRTILSLSLLREGERERETHLPSVAPRPPERGTHSLHPTHLK